jgi:hypothetical protein
VSPLSTSGEQETGFICSEQSALILGWQGNKESHAVLSFPKWGFGSNTSLFLFVKKVAVHLSNRWPKQHFHDTKYVIIPYWSIVFPLTVLSAYFLLANPRLAKKTEIA